MLINILSVIQHYSEPHRHYHNLTHIRRIFDKAHHLNLHLNDAQRLAVLFHDVIYNPASKTNEEDSVLRMRELCQTECAHDEDQLEKASTIILATKHHTHDDGEVGIVLDLDLVDLSADWSRFCYNERNIRKEYSMYDDAEWTVNRRNFLTGLLNKSQIFNTKLFRDKFQTAAIMNIASITAELGN